MPTYDFLCASGHRFEVFQKMSDDPVGECPECGAEARRQISGGTGFLSRESGGSGGSRGKTRDGGSSSGEPPHAPRDLTFGG